MIELDSVQFSSTHSKFSVKSEELVYLELCTWDSKIQKSQDEPINRSYHLARVWEEERNPVEKVHRRIYGAIARDSTHKQRRLGGMDR
jgi:hypothetical protein